MKMDSSEIKVYVDVDARFVSDGRILPRAVRWKDGRWYEIDRILDVRRAASLKAGGAGVRYTVRIGRQETFLFLEENRWFVERRTAV